METNKSEAVSIAKEILKMIGENDNVLGDISLEERGVYYAQISDKIIDLLKEKNATIMDIDLVFQLLMQAYESVSNAVINSIKRMDKIAYEKLIGKNTLDITVNDLDKVIKS